ncbi:helix-turn-helix domain-containing protein [Bifidobacterium eulemuris]|uniref:Helix-turn-helix domain-containing protein n=1 Tax=Bifidobacterium eulemuris TaxID=1765219 RepID=A0A261FY24_9BIFI|nr:AraC family transcriptional regulator [Bifidobacterium eulemuris]OZG64067.1 Helix-turn-helix domain-containing protein [Bifidobacterium eulemuris]QOL32572.1 helix-turn-helix transcriptional regulator [Bifidobacterium eulemuris]
MAVARHLTWSGRDAYHLCMPSRSAQQVLIYPSLVGRFEYETGQVTERTTFDSLLVMLVESGSMEIDVPGCVGVAHAGDVVLIDCYQHHRYVALEPTRALWAHFEGAGARLYYDEVCATMRNIITLPDEVREAVAANLRNLLDAVSGERYDELVADRLLTDVLGDLLLEAKRRQSEAEGGGDVGERSRPQGVRDAMTHIMSHINEPLSVSELAAVAGMGERSFMRAFKKETGYTPHAYIIEIRMSNAKSMLVNMTASLQEICDAVGFSSTNAFCMAFKNKTGMSPMEYRRRGAAVTSPLT